MPANLEDIPAWYAKEYERKVWARKKELIRLNQPKYNPGRTWRIGLATEPFGETPCYPYYPEDQPGKQPPPKTSPSDSWRTSTW